MKDARIKTEFLNGNREFFEEINELDEIRNFYGCFADPNKEKEERIALGKERIMAVYDYAFKNDTNALNKVESLGLSQRIVRSWLFWYENEYRDASFSFLL